MSSADPGGIARSVAGIAGLGYSGNMDEMKIEYTQSAFRHEYIDADIRQALRTKVYDTPMTGFINKYLLIGFDRAGNLLEIMYNPLDNDTINVFHAMKCRKSFLAKLGLQE
jgi:hypothetical protein